MSPSASASYQAVHLHGYQEDVLQTLAELVIRQHRASLPDLSQVHIILSELSAAKTFRHLLLQEARKQGHEAVLGLKINSLRDWAFEHLPAHTRVCDPQSQELIKDIAMHIAASEPKFVSKEDVTDEILAQEKEIYLEQIKAQGKPDHIAEKIVEGKLGKYYEENCLLEQPFVKNSDITVGQLVSTKIAEIGENIQVARFVRYQVGE